MRQGCENVSVLTVLRAVFDFDRIFSVFRFWIIFSTVLRFLIGPNAPLINGIIDVHALTSSSDKSGQ